MSKKKVAAGIAGLTGAVVIAGAVVYTQNPEILNDLRQDKPAQTTQVNTVEEHNLRIQNTSRENMIIECTNQIEFTNSFKEMKSKMPEQDQEKLNQAFNTVIQKKALSQKDIDENLCDIFKGWNEKRFLEEAEK